MATAIQSQFNVLQYTPFVVATFLNEGPEGARRLRDEVLLRSARLSRVTPAKQRELDQAASLIRVVNLEEQDRDELRTIVDIWLESKCEWPSFQAALLQNRLPVTPYSSFRVIRFVDGTEGIHSAPGTSAAQGLMLQLIQHPQAWRFAGKCSDCGRYMLRTTKHSKKYCNVACKRNGLIVAPKAQNRERVKARKVDHLKAAATKWEHSKTRKECVDFVLEEATELWRKDLNKSEWSSIAITGDNEIGKSSLTRWINEGLLTLPNEKKGARA